MQKLTAQDILFDSITSFGLGDVVKAKTPGEDMFFEGERRLRTRPSHNRTHHV